MSSFPKNTSGGDPQAPFPPRPAGEACTGKYDCPHCAALAGPAPDAKIPVEDWDKKKTPPEGGAPSTDSLPFHRRIDALADRVTDLRTDTGKAIERIEKRLDDLAFRIGAGAAYIVQTTPLVDPKALVEGADTQTVTERIENAEVTMTRKTPAPMTMTADELHGRKSPANYYAVDKHAESQPAARRKRRWWRLW